MWQQFWNKLGSNERKAVKAVGAFIVGVVVLVAVGQAMKPADNTLATDVGTKLSAPAK